MTALALDRKTDQYGDPDVVIPQLLSYPVAAAAKLFAGAMCAINASGLAVAASANNTLKIVGRVEKLADNTSGAASAINVEIRQGVFFLDSGTGADAIVRANVGALCYASDDHTVNLTDAGGTRPAAGVIVDIGSNGQIAVFLGAPSLYSPNPETSPSLSGAFRARVVQTVALAAYTAAAGVLTANANGAIGTADGATLVAGDVILLPGGIAAAVNDAGPYTVTSLGGASAKFVLTRPDWWPTAGVMKSGSQIRIGGEGTVFKNTTWQSMAAADTVTVDAADAKFYVLQVSGQTALVAGTFTISTVPVFSLKTNVDLVRSTANTCTSTTGGYHPTVAGATGITPGVLGTGAIVIQATVAAGTINVADVSTINWTVTNQP